jgi:hypothetical protein
MNTASKRPLKIGLFGIGLDTYWPQFKGLEQRLRGYVEITARHLKRPGVKVVNLGLVDNPIAALEAGHKFREADVDLIFLHVTTYALSSTVLPVVRRAKVPVIILNLSPTPAIDYAAFNKMGDRTKMTGEWLASCAACPVPEIANVFNRARIPFHQITGVLEGDPLVWKEVGEWVDAARVAHVMDHNRMGVMGHYYCGMLDIYSDLTQQCAYFGGHVEIVEVDELAALRADVSKTEIKQRVAEFHEMFDVQPECPVAELARAARTSVALDRLVAAHHLGSLAYYYRGTGNPANEDTITSIILGTSLLTGHGIPVAGELEIKNVQAMKIMDSFGVGRVVHRILRDGFQRRHRAHGPRRAGSHQDCTRQDEGASAPGLSRQSRARALGGDVRETRPGDVAFSGADGGWTVEPARGGRPVRARGQFSKSATRTVATALASVRGNLWRTGTRTARRITVRSVWGISRRRSRNLAVCWGWKWRGCANERKDLERVRDKKRH